MVKLTVSIVNYNAGDYLISVLRSLEKVNDEAVFDVYVVDNASSDDSIEKAKKGKFKFKVNFILNDENYGFGRAHNQVLKQAKTEFILISNFDVEFEKGTIKTMIERMREHPDWGMATCKVVLADGKIDLTAHRGFPTPMAAFKYYFLKDDSLYHLTSKDLSTTHEVDTIAGAFMLTRKSVLEKSGYFDEDYFMYAEEFDICYRVKEAGFKVMYVPEVKILHYKGVVTGIKKHSQGLTPVSLETRKRSINAFYKSMLIFYRKHYQGKYPFWVTWLVYLGVNLKWWLAKRKLTV